MSDSTELDLAGGPTWEKWGKASDRRGKNHTEIAKAFVADFPIGETLSTDRFDQWLQDNGLLTIPPIDAPKNSDAWLGHLQRRHIVRDRINKSATHPRMSDEGSQAFKIMAIRGGFEVQAPEVAASSAELPKKIATLIQTKRKQLSYLMQSADFSALPPHERAVAEATFDDIDNFVVDTRTAADRIDRKLAKLKHRIKLLMDTGAVNPTNGGLAQLIAPEVEE